MVKRLLCAAIEPSLAYCHSLYTQAHRESKDYPLEGFTQRGRVAVLANALGLTGVDIQNLEKEVAQDESSPWVVNGYLLSILPTLQNHLDYVARFCQAEEPLEDFVDKDLYFHEYRFTNASFVALQPMQREVTNLKYRRDRWRDFANQFKHGAPWVGLPSAHPRTGIVDVYDEDGVGMVYNVVVPIYKKACAMMGALGELYGQPIHLPQV